MYKKANDELIVQMFFARDERALALTQTAYEKAILSICFRILNDEEDTKECCNSVYFSLWSRIPPEKPRSLLAFITKIARDLAIDRYREKNREKRQGDCGSIHYDELADFLSDDAHRPEKAFESNTLAAVFRRFLRSLPIEKRRLFVLRYYHEKSIPELSKVFGISRQAVYLKLEKLKEQLKNELEKEGITP